MTDDPGVSGGVRFGTDEEARLLLDSVDEFVEREVAPMEEALGETWTNPRKRHEDDGRLVPEVVEAIQAVRRTSAEAGFYAMNLPADVGGGGVPNVTWYRARKQVATRGPGLHDHVLAGPEGPKPLLAGAEGEQVERFLEPVVEGRKSTAFAQTEPGVGSDSPNMATTADRDGDGWVVDGTKQWITNGPYADFVQVFARTTPQSEAGRYGGITCFLVESDEYEVASLNNAAGAEGMQAELVFDDVWVPDGRVLGEVGEAFYDAMGFLSLGRLEIGADAVGRAEFLLDRATEYANDREAFGRPIGEFQGVSHKLAEGRARAYAADAAGLRLAWRMDRGAESPLDSSVVKYLGSNLLFDVADDVLQVHGANGLAEENPFVEGLHLGRTFRVVEGTDEIQLNTIAHQMGVN